MGTKIRVYDAAESVKPYVERAMSDEKLRNDLMSAFSTARDLYDDLIGQRDAVRVATRVSLPTRRSARSSARRSKTSATRATGSRASGPTGGASVRC
jgi:hypothetical protein